MFFFFSIKYYMFHNHIFNAVSTKHHPFVISKIFVKCNPLSAYVIFCEVKLGVSEPFHLIDSFSSIKFSLYFHSINHYVPSALIRILDVAWICMQYAQKKNNNRNLGAKDTMKNLSLYSHNQEDVQVEGKHIFTRMCWELLMVNKITG